MKILITGSSGFIATTLIPKLARQGHSLVGVDSLVSRSENHLVTSDECSHHIFDLNDSSTLEKLLLDIDVVFHLAAKGNVVESLDQPLTNFHSNVTSTVSLLEAMRVAGCNRIIFASTGGALMGNCAPPVNELSLPRPISPYGASKLACEGYLSAYSESFNYITTSLRFGNVYGPFSSHKVGVINRWIRSAIRGEALTIFGDGNSSRDYIHVDDLTNGLLLALARLVSSDEPRHETYHLANHSEITLNELLAIIQQCHKPYGSLNVLYKPSRKGEVLRNFADITLARKILGFKPTVDFPAGVESLYQWISENE